MEKITEIIQEINSKIISSLNKSIDDRLYDIILSKASPPIKGKITKGKLKWRGISLKIYNYFEHGIWYQVIQRGKCIGDFKVPPPKIEFK